MSKIIDGAKEAIAVARGEQPAARIYINGHAYVPAATIEAQAAEIERLKSLVADYIETQYDAHRLAREIDVAMHGEEGAAQQPSLCDLVAPAKALKTRAEQAENALAKAVEVLRPFSTLASDYIDRGLDEDDHVLAGRIVRNNETASPPRVTFADFRRCRDFITEHGSDSKGV